MFAQAPPSTTSQSGRPPSLLHQIELEISDIIGQAQPAAVSIEGRTTLLNLIFPSALRSQLMQEFSKLPPERRAEAERNFNVVQEALKSTEKDKMFSVGPPQAGSGFLISGGFVVTTAEVVDSMTEIAVVLANGRRIRPLWINADPYSNIAVLKVDLPNAPHLDWGNSAHVRAGNFAIVIGNQAGFANSVSVGSISGINRAGRSGNLRYRSLIQFQGVVGAGNSGSPLIDSQGEVIGMVVAAPAGDSELPLPAPNQTNGTAPTPPEPHHDNAPPNHDPRSATFFVFDGIANTGFALPANHLRPIIETLCKGPNIKPIRDGWLGLRAITKPSPNDAGGLLVVRVYADNPAAKAGILPGDRILSINGQPIKSMEQMQQLTGNVKAGVVFQLEMRRNGIKHPRTLTTEPRPDKETLDQLPVLLPPPMPKD